jgi:rhodanese-related sulfurtransferase
MSLEPYLLLPLALVLFLMALPVLARKFRGPVRFEEPADLQRRLDTGEELTLIDLRPQRDFERGHLDGAVNLPAAQLTERLRENQAEMVPLKDRHLVVICQSDLKSIAAAKRLERQGFSQVSVLKGGMFRWKREHRLLISAGRDQT